MGNVFYIANRNDNKIRSDPHLFLVTGVEDLPAKSSLTGLKTVPIRSFYSSTGTEKYRILFRKCF